MGKRKSTKKVVAIVLAVGLFPHVVSADNVTDLYKMFGKSYAVEYPDEITDTISAYTKADKYVYQYQYIMESDFDKDILKKEKAKVKDQLDSAESILVSGYTADLEDIYTAEETYRNSKLKLSVLADMLKQNNVDYAKPKVDEIPTDFEYRTALRTKHIIDDRAELGEIVNKEYPIKSAALIDDYDGKRLYLITTKGSPVSSLWSGKVVQADEDSVILYHYNDVYTAYTDLLQTSVSVGDVVESNQTIGISSNRIGIGLKLDGEFVDINEVFKEVN